MPSPGPGVDLRQTGEGLAPGRPRNLPGGPKDHILISRKWRAPGCGENAAGQEENELQNPTPEAPDKSSELKAFLFLTVVMAPVLAGIIIGTYGLLVWIYQMFMGPPGA